MIELISGSAKHHRITAPSASCLPCPRCGFDAVLDVKRVHCIKLRTQAVARDADVDVVRKLQLGPRCFLLAFTAGHRVRFS